MKVVRDLIGPNHTKGRKGKHAVDVIVIHVMEGSMAGTRSWFRNSAAQVSAHYGISRKGEIVQYVDESDTAWHAGRVDKPSAAIIKERQPANPNSFSIGIEHEGSGKTELPAAQREASVWLIRDIAARRNIPLNRRHVIGHREIFSRKTCPGQIDVDALVREAAKPAGAQVQSDPPRIVWSDYLNDHLVVTRYVSDREWYFVPLKSLPAGQRAQTALSAMPRGKP